jgi:rRNA maturation endonuclease Nob1
MSYTPEERVGEHALSQATTPAAKSTENIADSPAARSTTSMADRKETIVQPKVSEVKEDESKSKLEEIVAAMEAKNAATSGAAAREVRDKQIRNLSEEGDKVSLLIQLKQHD